VEAEEALAQGRETADFIRNFVVQGVMNGQGNFGASPPSILHPFALSVCHTSTSTLSRGSL